MNQGHKIKAILFEYIKDTQQLNEATYKVMRALCKPASITLLRHLEQMGGTNKYISTRELANEMGVSSSYISAMIPTLVLKNLVKVKKESARKTFVKLNL